MQKNETLADADYAALASFRHAIRRFQAFSEEQAAAVGLTPQQHQALLAIRGCDPDKATVGHVAERLILKPHSATGLVNRLEALALIRREQAADDKRRALLRLTPRAYALLDALSATHREEIRRMAPILAEVFTQLG
ncbi:MULTISPECIES: MarR family winged helix-turn-helix transcriptional regulator [Sphingobium]|uniref:MarR family transcriptional regulator n=1 Tax=Sphingobium chungbukense TaxID=56193 RepID=A0A0M3ANL9_9SPHN|nr:MULTISPECIES: helix-turn-helix domain-containing protein [Sphingobium]AMK26111.1 MarR family transcriptional regulator [Sphingobium sp. TKS]KKW90531.1 MarR family transcriptional regulator [Sphingobium chungbukense]